MGLCGVVGLSVLIWVGGLRGVEKLPTANVALFYVGACLQAIGRQLNATSRQNKSDLVLIEGVFKDVEQKN